MASATLFAVTPFDATKEYTFTFDYTGNQAIKNKLLIKNNATGATVYEKELVTFGLAHKIPANTLKNGTTYAVQVRVYDSNNAATAYSTAVVFKCLATPVFRFSAPTNGQVVKNVSYRATLQYSQAQGEKLNSYHIELYDGNRQLLHQSETIYDVSNLRYVLDGFNNGGNYLLKAFGQTVSGVKVETAFVAFSVEYILPEMFSVVQIENDIMAGAVTVKSNLVMVEGKYDGTPIYSNGRINLTNGKPLIFDEGFKIGAEFSMQAVLEQYAVNTPLITMENGAVTVAVYKGKLYGANRNKQYVQLKDSAGSFSYIINSGYFTANHKIQINIRRRNGLYSLDVMEVS